MRKSLLIGLIVCLLAVSGIGAAFATGLDFTNGVGALSYGQADVPQANVDELYWGVETNDGNSPPMVHNVRLSFDQYLNQGTLIAVAIYGSSWNLLAETHEEIDAPLLASGNSYRAYFASPVPVANIYHIAVTVGEPVPFK